MYNFPTNIRCKSCGREQFFPWMTKDFDLIILQLLIDILGLPNPLRNPSSRFVYQHLLDEPRLSVNLLLRVFVLCQQILALRSFMTTQFDGCPLLESKRS
jgi:hypothetical protein